MNKFFTLIILSVFSLAVNAQTHISAVKIKEDEPYGVIDTTDLEMKQCDFEKDVNAEVLFDKADVNFDEYLFTTYIRHKRIKIFNDNGKDEANIKIPYIDKITDIQAETINLNGKTIEYTPVDAKLIYKQKVYSHEKALIFTFPNVKAGSVIELQYKWKIFSGFVPNWFFETTIPTRFSEISITFVAAAETLNLDAVVQQPFFKDTLIKLNGRNFNAGREYIKALANVPSFKAESFMSQESNNVQRLTFQSHYNFWGNVYTGLMRDIDFGQQLNNSLTDEKAALAKFDSIKNKDIKTDSIFNMVKSRMVWNKTNYWFTKDGTKKAWDKRTGNSTEINLILYHLLKQTGIEVYPMLVSTPDYGPIDPDDAHANQFNKTVVYVLVDSTKYYILDASDKHSIYNQVPFDLLSTYGFVVNPKNFRYNLINIRGANTARQTVFVNAAIQPNGKMSGTADIISSSYDKASSLKKYKNLGEKKYIDFLSDDDNNLKISSLKLDSAGHDSVPLTQHIDFNLDLTASDENYIYFNPNLFTSFGTNPFLSEKRYSDIDFIFANTNIISGIYKIPAGYKIDLLPKDQILAMEDKGISFKRIVGEQNGSILVRYIITRNKTFFSKEEYPGLYKFYKEMYEMLNEQIVLKKS